MVHAQRLKLEEAHFLTVLPHTCCLCPIPWCIESKPSHTFQQTNKVELICHSHLIRAKDTCYGKFIRGEKDNAPGGEEGGISHPSSAMRHPFTISGLFLRIIGLFAGWSKHGLKTSTKADEWPVIPLLYTLLIDWKSPSTFPRQNACIQWFRVFLLH